MDDGPKTFSLQQAMAAQAALRETLGLAPEQFPMDAFIGMLSDEIEQMRAGGHSDGGIAQLLSGATGQNVGVDEVARFYAPPERRRRE